MTYIRACWKRQFSLIDVRPLYGMTEACQKHGIKLLTYGTFVSLISGFVLHVLAGHSFHHLEADDTLVVVSCLSIQWPLILAHVSCIILWNTPDDIPLPLQYARSVRMRANGVHWPPLNYMVICRLLRYP